MTPHYEATARELGGLDSAKVEERSTFLDLRRLK